MGRCVSYQIPFTCSPHTTESPAVQLPCTLGHRTEEWKVVWQSRDSIGSRGRGWRAAHGHFAGGDLTDTPPPHQDAATFYVGNSFMVSKKTCAKPFEVV